MAQFFLTATKPAGSAPDKTTYEVYSRHRSAANSAFYHYLRGRGWTHTEIKNGEMREATPEERASLATGQEG